MASATYSRWREMAIWMIAAAIGARMIVARVPTIPSGLSSSPPKSRENWRKFAMAEMAPATIAAMLAMRMSRFLMWPISWARTPSSSRGGSACMMPWVTAIAACLGLRPVANALGCSAGVM